MKKLQIIFFVSTISSYQFVVVIPSFNNSSWLKKNIDSVYKQKEKHYRVIYINDASTDDTFKSAQNCSLCSQWSFIKNEKNQGALSNYYRAIHTCEDHEIIVALDGDDWLKHENVLAKIKEAYQNKNIWLTYGQYESSGSRKIGHCCAYSKEVIESGLFRYAPWYASHLRTFYAGLFKRIKLKDLLYNGKFFSMTWDLAFMLPMLEMAQERHCFIEEPLYVYNTQNSLSDFRKNIEKQLYYHSVIANRVPYKKLENLEKKEKFKKNLTYIVLGENELLLESFASYSPCYFFPVHNGVKKISEQQRPKQFVKIRQDYDPYNLYYENNVFFRTNLLKILSEIDSEWVMIVRNRLVKKDLLEWAFLELERTGSEVALFCDSSEHMSDFALVSPLGSQKETHVIQLIDIGKNGLYRTTKALLCKRTDLLDSIEKISFLVGFNAILTLFECDVSKQLIALLFS